MARPVGKKKVQNPNMMGKSSVVMRVVACCVGSSVGVWLIFCTTHMEPPTNRGNARAKKALFSLTNAPKSMPMNPRSRGMTSDTPGSQEYRRCDRVTRSSGVSANTVRNTWNRPKKIGICRKNPPRHPTGFTPASLKSLICSRWRRCLSFLYFSCISLTRGWSPCMARMDRSWRTVSGYIKTRVAIVNMMIATPKFWPKME